MGEHGLSRDIMSAATSLDAKKLGSKTHLADILYQRAHAQKRKFTRDQSKAQAQSMLDNWKKASTTVMESLLRAKFRKNNCNTTRLLQTGNRPLAELGTGFWAQKGANTLGLLLEKVRSDRQQGLYEHPSSIGFQL